MPGTTIRALIASIVVTGCGFTAGGEAAGTGDDGVDAGDPIGGSGTSDDAGTPTGPYPIILAHGAFGTDQFGGVVDYFYGVRAELETAGRRVYTPRVDAIQGPEVRGAQLAIAIDAALAETGASKVVIVGHSQGGLDARWVANHYPDRVAAVVTIGTPHRGSVLADIALGFSTGSSTAAMDAWADLFGSATPGSESSFDAQMMSMSTPGSAAFNVATPDAAGVAYYSIGGRSAYASASSCPASTVSSPFMQTWDDELDPVRVSLLSSSGMVAAASLPATPVQDGLVTVDSMMWGTWLGCVPADHLDEVCMLGGPGLFNDFDCLAFWRGIEEHLSANQL